MNINKDKKMEKKSFFWFVPNSITSLNVLSGCLSIVFAFEGNIVAAGLLILIAAVFDFFDGFAARMLKAYSEMGKQLDSLADMISFGVAPTIIAFQLLKNIIAPNSQISDLTVNQGLILLIPFIMAIFSALRLAKFNIDTRQSESFIGVPTPANAMVWASFPLILQYQNDSIIANWLSIPIVIILLIVLLSSSLVTELPLFSLKFKNFSFTDNKLRFSFLILSAALIAFFGFAAIPMIIILYIIMSIIFSRK